MEPFGSPVPFAEPAWYTGLHSPYWSQKHVQLRAYLRKHYNDNILPHAGEWEAAGVVPDAVWQQHAALGFAAAAIFPGVEEKYYEGVAELGGVKRRDWDIWCDFLMADEATRLGYLGVNWGLGGGNGIGAPPICSFGTPDQKERWLRPVLKGDMRCCLGITEATGGSDVAGLRTTARRSADGRNFVVNGSKKWM
ncbi:hypothetical protein RQP46_006708 [Phenoliferia psychrophenolica]